MGWFDVGKGDEGNERASDDLRTVGNIRKMQKRKGKEENGRR